MLDVFNICSYIESSNTSANHSKTICINIFRRKKDFIYFSHIAR